MRTYVFSVLDTICGVQKRQIVYHCIIIFLNITKHTMPSSCRKRNAVIVHSNSVAARIQNNNNLSIITIINSMFSVAERSF